MKPYVSYFVFVRQCRGFAHMTHMVSYGFIWSHMGWALLGAGWWQAGARLGPGWTPRTSDPSSPPLAGPLDPLIPLPPPAGPLEPLILLPPGGLETSKVLRGVGSKPLSSSGGWAGDL